MFSNPFFVILVIFGFISIVWAHMNDGQPMPQRNYSATQTTIAVMINWFLVIGAIWWAAIPH